MFLGTKGRKRSSLLFHSQCWVERKRDMSCLRLLISLFTTSAQCDMFSVDSMGRMILAGGAAVGLGALCYYGMGMSNEIGAIEKAM